MPSFSFLLWLLRLPKMQPLLFFGNCFAELYIYKKDVETLYCCSFHVLKASRIAHQI